VLVKRIKRIISLFYNFFIFVFIPLISSILSLQFKVEKTMSVEISKIKKEFSIRPKNKFLRLLYKISFLKKLLKRLKFFTFELIDIRDNRVIYTSNDYQELYRIEVKYLFKRLRDQCLNKHSREEL